MISPAVFYGCETSSFTVRGIDNAVGHVACKEEIRNAYAIWWKILKVRAPGRFMCRTPAL